MNQDHLLGRPAGIPPIAGLQDGGGRMPGQFCGASAVGATPKRDPVDPTKSPPRTAIQYSEASYRDSALTLKRK